MLSIFSSGLVPFLFRDVENALILMIVFMAVGGGRTCIYLWSFSSVSKDYSHSCIRYCSFHLLKDLAPVSLPVRLHFLMRLFPLVHPYAVIPVIPSFLKIITVNELLFLLDHVHS